MSQTSEATGPTPAAAAAAAAAAAPPAPAILGSLLGVLRIALGWVLLWAGVDKVFGLGYPTEDGQAVIDGASATEGYLQHALTPGSAAEPLLQPLAGNPLIDVLYLAGTLGAGVALLLGVGVRIAGLGGAALFVMLWFSSLPLEYNPFLDQHLFWALSCLLVVAADAGRHLGLGRWWQSTTLVSTRRWLA